MSETRYLTAEELRQRWNFKNVRKIYKMKAQGDLPYLDFGGSIRFAITDIEEFERTHRMARVTPAAATREAHPHAQPHAAPTTAAEPQPLRR